MSETWQEILTRRLAGAPVTSIERALREVEDLLADATREATGNLDALRGENEERKAHAFGLEAPEVAIADAVDIDRLLDYINRVETAYADLLINSSATTIYPDIKQIIARLRSGYGKA
jgi:hypothetical protein